ncbi:hypothetical protein BKN14_02675 [Candidatus Gracilibacteria bacterium HOT-871]|nr:hypothetical protein BKN14_02675 [Candidatus Gracilibacteria bacterium HOT-871]
MNLLLFIKQAFLAIRGNKLRSFLSTLGIIIGISSFVIMLAIGEGTKQQMLSYFADSSNVVNIDTNEGPNQDGKPKSSLGKNIFTEEITSEILEKVPHAQKLLLEYNLSSNPRAIYKAKDIGGALKVIPKNFFSIKKGKIMLGTYFGQDDYDEERKVAIIGYKLVRKVFGTENPIGKKLSIGGEIFSVSGVLEEKGYDFDEGIFIPNTTAKKYFGKTEISRFMVFADKDENVDSLKKDLGYFLLKRSGLDNYSDVKFRLSTNKDMMKQISDMSKSFTYFLVGIGAISLVVGGIGIMNIMLVSVTERTREIGIRKAIGATNFNIMYQFLIEAIILTLIGSLIAIGLSYGLARVINNFSPPDLGFKCIINTNILFIAIAVSVTMGLSFGLMPAYKAARLKPIDALHFE